MLELDRIRPFSGGLRMRPYKALSTTVPLQTLPMPPTLVIPMAQHAGPPAVPTVSVGEHVTWGQVIGRAAAARSVAVHASGSGTVTALDEHLVPSGSRLISSLCVTIATDPPEQQPDAPQRVDWPEDVSARLESIRDAGLTGLGGAAFPTATKLGAERGCQTLILNGAECEPYISCDDMLMREHPASVLQGAILMLELLHAQRCIIAIERDKSVALDAITTAVQAQGDDRLVIAAVPTVYPAGGERQLVESLLEAEVPSGRYPIDIGVVCQNVGTAHALAELVTAGRPLVTRIVTLTGHGLRNPQNVEVPIGVLISNLVEHCGGLTSDAAQLILGGNMMGYALPSDDFPVTKSTNCVIALSASEVWMGGEEWPCIRCGECANACPARLLPQELLVAGRADRFDGMQALGLEDCIECGCCDVVCPSHIPLTSRLRTMKAKLAAQQEHEAIASAAQARYDEHIAREDRVTAEERRHQTELTAPLDSDDTSRRAAIQAAIARANARRQRRDNGD
jgi:electron transport complex protein RnfC